MATTLPQIPGTPSFSAAPNNKRNALQASLSLECMNDGRKRFRGCSKIADYAMMSKLGEGTFGEVHKAESKKTRQIVAMKKILMHQEKDGFPVTALREIKLLKMLAHPNVLKLEEMAVEKTLSQGRKKAIVYMVTPYMDHDLSGLLENPAVKFTEATIKCYMMQLLEGVAYLHAKNILHRDMKAANLLINNEGVLQIADFGLARPYDDTPPQAGKGNGISTRPYTTVVVTRWYRPPELLLQLRYYTPAIDMWGVGCVFGELFKGHPILPGNSDVNQINLIFDLMGSPNELNMPGWTKLPGCEGIRDFQPRHSRLNQDFREQGSCFISLMAELLKLDWTKRINALDALQHPYFKTHPLPDEPKNIPPFQESHELDRRKFREQKANLPPAPAGGTVGMGTDRDFSNGQGSGPGYAKPAFYHDQRHPHLRNNERFDRNAARYDSRAPAPPPPANGLSTIRRPPWTTGPQPNGLPPRPPPPAGGLDHGGSFRPHVDGARDRLPRESGLRDTITPRPRVNLGANNTDTYIPAYSRNLERNDHSAPGHDTNFRDRDEMTARRDVRARCSEDRTDRDGRDHGHRPGRSRSPERDRHRDRGRRDRDRERDIYRR